MKLNPSLLPLRRFHLRFLVIAAGLVALWIAGTLAIPRLIDVNSYRGMIQTRISDRLGRPVSLGRMELSLFPQLTAVLHDVKIGGDELAGQGALTASTVRARARLLPLLISRRLHVTAIALEEPNLVLIRDAAGQWNWQRMLEGNQAPPSMRDRGAQTSKTSLTVRDLSIHAGTIRVIDDAAEPGQSIQFTLEPLDVDVRGYGAGRRFDVDIDGVVTTQEGRGSVHFAGEVGPLPVPFNAGKMPIDATIKSDAFPLRALLPYVASEQGIRSLDGKATSDLQLVLRPDERETRAKGTLKFDKVLLSLGGASPRTGLFDFDASLDVTRKGSSDLVINDLDLTLGRGKLSLEGKVGGTQAKGVSLKLDGRDISIHALAPLARFAGADLPLDAVGSEPIDIKGTIETRPAGGATQLVLRDLQIGGIAASVYRSSNGWSAGKTQRPQLAQTGTTRLQVENLKVDRANLLILDAVAGRGQPVPLRLTDVKLEVDRYGTGNPGRGSFVANIAEGGRIEGSGTFGPAANGQLPIDAKLRLEKAKVRAIRQYMTGFPGLESGSGEVDLDVQVRGRTPERLALQGKASLRDVAVGTAQKALDGDIAFDVAAQSGGKLIAIETCKLSLPSGTFSLSGSLDSRGGGTIADLSLAPARVKVDDLQPLAALAGFKVPGTLRSPEEVEVAVRVRGDLADRKSLNVDGSLKTNQLTWEAPFLAKPLENVGATVRFSGHGFDANGVRATLGETQLLGDLAIRNFAEPDLTFSIASDRANLSELLTLFSAGSSPERQSAGTASDWLAKMKGQGTVTLGSGTFNTLAFSALRGTMAMNGRVLRLAPVELAVYKGKYQGDLEIDLRGDVPLFKQNCTLSGIDVNEFLAGNTNFKDALYGTLSGRLGVQFRGKTMDDVLRSMDGGGDLAINDGKLKKVSMLGGLSNVADLFGEATLSQVSQKSAANETPFSTLTAPFTVRSGWVSTDNFLLQSNDLAFHAKGGFGFDRRLQLSGQVVFSEAISQSLRAERSRAIYFGEEKGLVAIPVAVEGSVDRPSYIVDFGAAAQYAVTKTITDKLTEALFGNKKAPKAPDTAAAPQAARPTPSPADTAAAAQNIKPAPSGSGRPDTTTPVAPLDTSNADAKPAELNVRVDSHAFKGKLLQPELTIKGAVSGNNLASLVVVITDEDKDEVHRDTFLTKEIAAAYGTRPRNEAITVPFDIRISGSDLPPLVQSLNVKLTVLSESGASASTSFSEKKALGLNF